jgi:hypothetical protein
MFVRFFIQSRVLMFLLSLRVCDQNKIIIIHSVFQWNNGIQHSNTLHNDTHYNEAKRNSQSAIQ